MPWPVSSTSAGVGLGGAQALQHVTVEGDEFMQVEAQRRAAAGQGVGEFGPGPVDNRHEVVADRRRRRMAARLRMRLAVVVEDGLEVAFADLDAFSGSAGSRPRDQRRPRRLSAAMMRLALLDLLDAPDRRHRGSGAAPLTMPCRAGLPGYGQSWHDIVRPEPAPSLFHGTCLIDGWPNPVVGWV